MIDFVFVLTFFVYLFKIMLYIRIVGLREEFRNVYEAKYNFSIYQKRKLVVSNQQSLKGSLSLFLCSIFYVLTYSCKFIRFIHELKYTRLLVAKYF